MSAKISLILLLVAATCASMLAAPAQQDVQVDKLQQLIETVKAHNSPSVDEVLDAYRQYVDLYKAQAYLAQEASSAGSDSDLAKKDEKKYEQISELLTDYVLQEIVERIFCEIPDDQTMTGQIELTESQRMNLKKAIDSFF